MGPMIAIMLHSGFVTVQQNWPAKQSLCDTEGQFVSMLQFASASRYDRPQKLIREGSLYLMTIL